MMLINSFLTVQPSVLLLKFEGADGSTTFIDSGMYNHTVTAFNGASPTIQSNSGYFTDATAVLSIIMGENFNPTTYSGDFTIEAIVNTAAFDGSYRGIIGRRYNSSTNDWVLYVEPSGQPAVLVSFTDESSAYVIHQNYITANTDAHIAAVRVGGIIWLYVDGVKSDTFIDMTTKTIRFDGGSAATHIGKLSYVISNNSISGYIRDLRIKKQAVYAATFTPPLALT